MQPPSDSTPICDAACEPWDLRVPAAWSVTPNCRATATATSSRTSGSEFGRTRRSSACGAVHNWGLVFGATNQPGPVYLGPSVAAAATRGLLCGWRSYADVAGLGAFSSDSHLHKQRALTIMLVCARD